MSTITHIILTCNANARGGSVSLQCQGQPFLPSQTMGVNQQINILINMGFSPSAQVILTIARPGLPNANLAMDVYESPTPTIQQKIFTIPFAAYTVDCHVAQP